MDSPTAQTQGFCFNANGNCEFDIIGEGYFTDSTLSENKGKKMTITDKDRKDFYVSNGDFDISILPKYKVVDICFAPFSNVVPNEMPNKSICIDDLKYSLGMKNLRLSSPNTEGKLESLCDMVNLKELKIANTRIVGDISSLRNLNNLNFIQMSNTTGISGNASSISGLTALTALQLSSTKVSLDLSYISNLKNLTYVDGDAFSGDVASIQNLTSLGIISSPKATITGDISKLSPVLRLLSVSNYAGAGFNWTKRESTSSIIAILGGPKISNLDNMLIDEAACVAQQGTGIYRIIEVSGVRTSASDNAIQTLQSKGFTVTVNPA